MKIYEIMSSDVKKVGAQSTVAEAARLMKEANVGLLPIVNGLGAPVGVITDRDLALCTLAGDVRPTFPVKDAMKPVRYTIGYDEEIRVALNLMREKRVERLLVVNNAGALVGVVSLHDVATAYDPGTQTASVHSALRSRVPARWSTAM